jgi:hypothetical protein
MKVTGERTIVTDNPSDTRYRLVFDDLTDAEVTGLSMIHRHAAGRVDAEPNTGRVLRAATDAIREMLDVDPGSIS